MVDGSLTILARRCRLGEEESIPLLEYQNAHHGFSGVRRSSTLRAFDSRRDAVNFSGQCGEVDVLLNLSQRIADPVDLFTVMFAGKEVVFDCATLLHGTNWSDD